MRRLCLFIEESIYKGTKWVVFEPNNKLLWAKIRHNIEEFMHKLFLKGAFQGAVLRDSYFVKCDGNTTSQYDLDQGIVNVVVGFAPLRRTEFVVTRIQQITGQGSPS